MSDLLIRDVPENVIAAIDAAAKTLGLSRTEYLRRTLAREDRPVGTVTRLDLQVFSEKFGDLLNEEVVAQAWQ